jgi:hypothetical protein
MSSLKSPQQKRKSLGEYPEPGARLAAFLLIALLTALIVLAHSLELGAAPVAVLACFLALAVLTGGLVVSVLAHRSGRG